jgi:hypothetical protein
MALAKNRGIHRAEGLLTPRAEWLVGGEQGRTDMRTMTFRTWGVLGLGLVTACGSVLVACGGDDSGAVVTVDGGGGGDSSSLDGGADSASDATHMDSAATDGPTPDGASSDGATGDGDAAEAACDTPAAGVYYVDPANGSDTTNGSGTAGGTVAGRCAFKTITFALTTIGTPTAATAIHVLGISTVSAGETFPLVIPANVTIDTMGGSVTVALPASATTNAFTLAGAASGLTGLTIDGSAAAGSTSGVIVNTGAASTTFVNAVEVKGFGGPGIQVQGTASFTIDGGTSVHDNGTATGTLKKSGLYVTGTAKVTASIAAGGAEVSFASNAGEGVLVDSNASVAFMGAPGTGGAGTLVMHDNATNGIRISATPAIGSGGSTLTGVVLWHNTGEGAELVAGATVTVRSSVALENGDNGILISPSTTVSLTNPVANIDLGSAHDGMNVVQDATTGNSAAGICNGVTGTQLVPAALNAQGNTFDSHDCSISSSSAVVLTTNNCATGTGVDVGIKGTYATISTTYCTN